MGPATASGIARATRDLAAALAARGHSVHLITRSHDAPAREAGGATVHTIGAPLLRDDVPALDHLAHAAAVHRALAEIHERERLDVAVTPLWGCEGLVCLLDDRFPTVVSCMTSMRTIEELRGNAGGGEEAAQLVALERATMGRARYVHGLTGSALDKTLADYGAEPVEAEVVGRALADRAGRGPERPRGARPEVLFVGRLERRKGVAVLLEAARRLAADGVDLSLVLAGPDSHDTETGEPYRAAFERELRGDATLAGRVRFAGAVPDAELDDLYRRADVVCVPSRYESHGVVPIEAMMFGKPIVACAVGGLPEVLERDGNALLAAPGDPASLARELRRLIEDAELRRRFGLRSRALYEERFEVGAVAAAMEGFLRRVIAAHPRAETAPAELPGRLAAVVSEVLSSGEPGAAAAIAAELLSPSPDAWRAATERAERACSAWQERAHEAERQVEEWRARALEAERQRAAAEAELARVSASRWWRLTRPLRRVTHALRVRSRAPDGSG